MRRIFSALLLLVALAISPSTTMAGAGPSQMSFSRSSAPPATEVTVEIQLDRPPVEGTTYGMTLERSTGDPEAFTVTDPVPFDADGYALFTFTVPDAAPGEYYPQFGCVNASASGDACDDPESPNFGPLVDVVLTVTDPVPPSDYEEVVFRVTLSGLVPAGDRIGVAIECDRPCITEDFWLVCGPPSDTYILPVCDEGTFEFTAEIEAGRVLDYALVRLSGPDYSTGERHLPGSIVVQEGRQTISLGYDYSGTPAPTAAPALPDTATTQPTGFPPAGGALTAAAMLLLTVAAVSRAQRKVQ